MLLSRSRLNRPVGPSALPLMALAIVGTLAAACGDLGHTQRPRTGSELASLEAELVPPWASPGTPSCAAGKPCPDGLRCVANGCYSTYFHDERDGGNDPLRPGCHYAFSDPQCRQDRLFLSADSCRSSTVLREWTDIECHGPRGDVVVHDCPTVCRRLGLNGGVCVVDLRFCDDRFDSAHCECEDPTIAKPPAASPRDGAQRAGGPG